MQDNECPSSRSRKHYFTMFQVKADFEPVEFGLAAEDTKYKRVEYSYLFCNCGASKKKKIVYE